MTLLIECQPKGWTRGSDCCGWVVVETRKPGYALGKREQRITPYSNSGWMDSKGGGGAHVSVNAFIFIGEAMGKGNKNKNSSNGGRRSELE